MKVFEAISNDGNENVKTSVNEKFDVFFLAVTEDQVLSIMPCIRSKETKKIVRGSTICIQDTNFEFQQYQGSEINHLSTLLFLLKAVEQLDEK